MKFPIITKIAAAAGACLLAGQAHADPISLIGAGAALGFTGTTALVVGAVATYGGYVMAAYSVFSAIQARKKAKARAARAQAAATASITDRTQTILQEDPPRRFAYGDCIVGGTVCAEFVSDKYGQQDDGSVYTKEDGYQHIVVAFVAHQSQEITEFYVNDHEVGLSSLDSNGWTTTGYWFEEDAESYERTISAGGNATYIRAATVLSCVRKGTSTTASYTISGDGLTITNPNAYAISVSTSHTSAASNIRVSWHLGSDTQTVDTYLNGLFPSDWDANHRMRGITYAVFTLDMDCSELQGGCPSFSARGKWRNQVYDPRTGTYGYTQNPALCIADWLQQEWGYGVSYSEIDEARLIASANVCDQSVSFPKYVTVGGTTVSAAFTGKRYLLDGGAATDEDKAGVLSAMADAMAGDVYPATSWVIQAGQWEAPVMTLTDDDLAGMITLEQAGADLENIFNGVRATYVPYGESSAAELKPYQNSTYVTADGAELWETLDLGWVAEPARVQNICRIRVEESRAGLVISAPFKMTAFPVQPGDRVYMTSSLYGWTAKPFICSDWSFGLQSPVTLRLEEDAEEIYDEADATTVDQDPNTSLPNPYKVNSPTGVAAESGTAQLVLNEDGTLNTRVLVSWDLTTDQYVLEGGSVEIGWRRVGKDDENTWNTTTVAGTVGNTLITNQTDGDVLTIRVRFKHSLASSSYAFISHTVVGKSAAPGVPASISAAMLYGGVQFTVPANTDLDAGYTEIRYGSTSWASATVIGRMVHPDTKLFWNWPALGTHDILAAYVDTSGNIGSALLGSVTVTDAIYIPSDSVSGLSDTSVNFVKHPTFEDGLVGEWVGSSQPDIVSVSGQAWTKALRIKNRDNNEQSTTAISVTPGETVYAAMSCDSSSAAGTVVLGLELRNADQSSVAWIGLCAKSAGGSWSYVSGSATIPAGYIYARPWLQIDASPGSTGTAIVNNLYIGRTQLGATVGAAFDVNITGQITSSNVSTYIQNLAVQTLQIADQAVTIPVHAYTAGGVNMVTTAGAGATGPNGGTNWATLQSATITSTGAPIAIRAGFNWYSSTYSAPIAYLAIYRGSTLLLSVEIDKATNLGPDYQMVAFPELQDTPGSGTFTYTLISAASSSTAYNRSLSLMETKK